MARTAKDYLLLSLRGVGMGAADVVPGVSGGTIAFITGIYEELVNSIRSIDATALGFVAKGRLVAAWKHINGSFLLALFAGVFAAVLSLARVLEYLLEVHPVLVWSFFFGLVLASTYVVSRKVSQWTFWRWTGLVAGAALAFAITSFTPATTTDALWFVFLSGALASCAMILPGISGSFILLLLGKYSFALHAVNEKVWTELALLAGGALVGIISFSRLLSWLLKSYHDATVTVLVGFMIGSLNKIWPWKQTLETILVEGVEKPLIEKNVWPVLSDAGDRFWAAVLLGLAGMLVILVLELVLGKKPDGK
ncbi:MAG: DUF368 domain-containing protein [Bacteroidales bacterium]